MGAMTDATNARSPRMGRSVVLNFQGDPGTANFHRICSWISHFFLERSGPHTRIGIWNGTGGWDNVHAVGRGEMDLALASPADYVKEALRGGPNCPEAYPDLRALAVIPQADAMLFAVPAALGVKTLAQLHEKKPPLRIAIPPDDGSTLMGCAAHRMLDEAGITREKIGAWGGCFVETAWWPQDCIELVTRGQADAVVHEAIMTPWWHDLVRDERMAPISLDSNVLDSLERKYGWGRFELPAGYFAGHDEAIHTLEFSDFLIFVRSDMPDDVAHLITWCLLEKTPALFTRQFAHIAPERRSVTLPLVPKRMAAASIPLHPGALRYYTEAGVL